MKRVVILKKQNIFRFLCALFLTTFTLSYTLKIQAQPDKEHLLTHVGKYPNYPQVDYGTGPQAELIKKGEYLTQAGDCIACHTKPGGLPFAGGLPIVTPFGTIYSPNITSDKTYGIGKWTLPQFVKAMREGVAPDGSNYFPVFPYPHFNKVTDEDLAAIKAYFDVVPPVPAKNQGLDMAWPFRWRFLQYFWKLMFFDFQKGIYKPDPSHSAQWNRGAYLVQGLGHCGMCHTPLNVLGAPEEKYALTGGFGSGSYAPNISFSRFVNTSVAQIVNVFINNKLVSGQNIIGPMAEVVHDSLEYLSPDDLSAIATYLKSVQSRLPPAKTSKVTKKTGQKIYDKYCTGCHSIGAGGAPKIGDPNDWVSRLKLGKPAIYKNAITGIGAMPPRGTCATCSDDEIKAAVDYILDNSKGGGAPPVVKGPKLLQPNLQLGEKIYKQVCSICHDRGQLGAPVIGDKEDWEPIIKKNMDVLITHTIAGYKGMPPRGACYYCSDTDLIAAVIYMVNQSKTAGNYQLW